MSLFLHLSGYSTNLPETNNGLTEENTNDKLFKVYNSFVNRIYLNAYNLSKISKSITDKINSFHGTVFYSSLETILETKVVHYTLKYLVFVCKSGVVLLI